MKFFHIYAGRRTHDDVARVFECSTDEIRKAESSALRRRAAYYRLLLPNRFLPLAYSVLTSCLLRAYSMPTPCSLHAYSLLTTCLPLAYYLPALPTRWLILSLYLRRLRSHVQIRSVLRDSVDPYALENVDF